VIYTVLIADSKQDGIRIARELGRYDPTTLVVTSLQDCRGVRLTPDSVILDRADSLPARERAEIMHWLNKAKAASASPS
jgi:hypothetical protein